MPHNADHVIETFGAAGDENKLSPLRSHQVVTLPADGEVWMTGDIHDHRNNFRKLLVAAGEKIADDATHVIVHDAARPAVAYSDIEELLSTAEKHKAVSLATPIRSTLVEVDEAGNPIAYAAPTRFMNLVTPQAFEKSRFLEMCRAKVEVHASEVTLLKGSPLNVRVGGPGDAGFVKTMINMLPKPKTRGPLTPFQEAQW